MGKSLSMIAISIQVYCIGCSHHTQFRKRQLLMKQTKSSSKPFATDVLSHITNFLEPHNAAQLQLSHKKANDAVKKGQNLKILQDEIHQQILKLNRLQTTDYWKIETPNLLNSYDKDLKQLLINIKLSDEFIRETPNIIKMLHNLFWSKWRGFDDPMAGVRRENCNEIHKILFGFGLERQEIKNRFTNKQKRIFERYNHSHTKILSIVTQEINEIIRSNFDMDPPNTIKFKQFYGFIFKHYKNVINTKTELPALKDIGYLRFNQDSKLRQDQWILINDLANEFSIIFYHHSFIYKKLPEKINILEYITRSSYDYDLDQDEFKSLEKILTAFNAHWTKTILDHHDGRQYDVYKMYDDQHLIGPEIIKINSYAIVLEVIRDYQSLFKYLEIFKGLKTFRFSAAYYLPTDLDLAKILSNVQWIFKEFRDKDCIKMLELMIGWNSEEITKPTSIKYIARWLIGKFATNEEDKQSYDVYGNSTYIANMLYHKVDVLHHDENIINELDNINYEFKFCDDEQKQKQFFDELKYELVVVSAVN